jgi:hypothetical protein
MTNLLSTMRLVKCLKNKMKIAHHGTIDIIFVKT